MLGMTMTMRLVIQLPGRTMTATQCRWSLEDGDDDDSRAKMAAAVATTDSHSTTTANRSSPSPVRTPRSDSSADKSEPARQNHSHRGLVVSPSHQTMEPHTHPTAHSSRASPDSAVRLKVAFERLFRTGTAGDVLPATAAPCLCLCLPMQPSTPAVPAAVGAAA
jgi:hypothetical protein